MTSFPVLNNFKKLLFFSCIANFIQYFFAKRNCQKINKCLLVVNTKTFLICDSSFKFSKVFGPKCCQKLTHSCKFHSKKTASTNGCVLKESVCLLVMDRWTFTDFWESFRCFEIRPRSWQKSKTLFQRSIAFYVFIWLAWGLLVPSNAGIGAWIKKERRLNHFY